MAQAKRKKRFFDIEVPIIRRETNLQAYESTELEGRIIRYDLTRMLKGKNVILSLVVKKSEKNEKEHIAVPRKIEMIHSTLSRMVRRGTDYVEDSFSADCKDAKLTIKPFLITRRKVHNSVKRALREKAKEELIAYVKDKKSEELFEELIRNQLQKPMSLKLKKIYPLSAFEIRILKVEKTFEPAKETKKTEKQSVEPSVSEKEKETEEIEEDTEVAVEEAVEKAEEIKTE
jgi:ribosomal protein S3AE